MSKRICGSLKLAMVGEGEGSTWGGGGGGWREGDGEGNLVEEEGGGKFLRWRWVEENDGSLVGDLGSPTSKGTVSFASP